MRERSGRMNQSLQKGVDKVPHFQRMDIGGIPGDIYTQQPDNSIPATHRKAILFFHGGAYCMHHPNMYRLLLADLCGRLELDGFIPDYRLAPEHPHPAGIEDCYAVYQELLSLGYKPENLVMLGDSAGGGLAVSVLQKAYIEGAPMPSCAVLLSPAGDWSLLGKSFYENERRDPMFNLSTLLYFRDLYLDGHSMTDPMVSPLYGSFDGFPPLYVTASSTELIRDIAVGYVEKTHAAGGSAQLEMAEGLVHDYPVIGFLPESRATRSRIVEFCRRHLS